MKRNIIALLLTLLFAASVNGQTHETHGQADGWKTFTSEKGKFSILVPVTPTEEVSSGNDSRVGSYTLYLFTSKIEGAIYLFGWADYKTGIRLDVDGELKANRDNFLKALGATLLTETKISLDGNPGIEFTAEKKPNIFIRSRVYVISGDAYQSVAISIGQEDSKSVNKFLESFKLTTQR